MKAYVVLTALLFYSFVLHNNAYTIGQASKYCQHTPEWKTCLCHSIDAPHQDTIRLDLDVSYECTTLMLQDSNVKRLPENWLKVGRDSLVIWIFNSHLKEIRQSDFLAPRCWFVDLSINDLEELPTRVFSIMTNLQQLYIQENKLRILHNDCFGNLSGLYSLRLQNNELEYLDPTIFYPLTNLSELNLSYNKIKYLEGTSFMYNTGLEELNLEYNNLKIVDPELTRISCSRASVFMRNYSDRRTSTEIFASLSKLKALNVAANIFTYIGRTTFARNRNLEKVDMTATNLSCIAIGAFVSNINLNHITLGENDMKEVDMILFMQTQALKFLDLRGNSLTELKNLDQIRLPESLSELKLRYNDFSCTYLLTALNSLIYVRNVDIRPFRNDIDCFDVDHSKVCGKVRRRDPCQQVTYEL